MLNDKKYDRKENSKNHVENNESCGFSCYNKIGCLKNHDKKVSFDTNIVKNKNKEPTFEEQIHS